VSLKLDLAFDNVGEYPDSKGKMDPALGLIFNGAASQALGPGSLSFELQVSPRLHFGEAAASGVSLDADDNLGDITYALAAGPGTLGIGFTCFLLPPGKAVIYRPHIEYTGIAAGPANVGVGFYADFPGTGHDDGFPISKPAPFGNSGAKDESLGLWVTASFDFGLYLKLGFDYGYGENASTDNDGAPSSGITRILYVDINYKVMPNPLLVGVEVDNTGKEFKGFRIKPYVSFTLDANMSLGAYCKLDNVGGEKDVNVNPPDGKGTDSMIITPGVWFKYTL
jgi:hypothetical protein